MNIDKRIKREQEKLQSLKERKFTNRLAGKFVILAGIYKRYDKKTRTYKTVYNYYINPKTALLAYHKKAQHLINIGIPDVVPIKTYPQFTFHKISWGMSNRNPVNCNAFLFTRNEAKALTANSPYPSILFNAIQPAKEAHPNDMFFKKPLPYHHDRGHDVYSEKPEYNNGYNIVGERQY